MGAQNNGGHGRRRLRASDMEDITPAAVRDDARKLAAAQWPLVIGYALGWLISVPIVIGVWKWWLPEWYAPSMFAWIYGLPMILAPIGIVTAFRRVSRIAPLALRPSDLIGILVSALSTPVIAAALSTLTLGLVVPLFTYWFLVVRAKDAKELEASIAAGRPLHGSHAKPTKNRATA